MNINIGDITARLHLSNNSQYVRIITRGRENLTTLVVTSVSMTFLQIFAMTDTWMTWHIDNHVLLQRRLLIWLKKKLNWYYCTKKYKELKSISNKIHKGKQRKIANKYCIFILFNYSNLYHAFQKECLASNI